MARAFPRLSASLKRPLANRFCPRYVVRCYAITPSRDHSQDGSPAKKKYPGLGLDIRHDDSNDRDVTYPVGIHFNCYGSESEMLLVREVAMMMVMESITDKPDWHVKVFDAEITNKWKAEALALPVDAMYKEIAEDRIAWHDGAFSGQPPKPRIILDEACVDYVRLLAFVVIHVRVFQADSAVVHQGAACQGRVFQEIGSRAHVGCLSYGRQV